MDVREQLVVDRVDDRARRGARDRVAAERRGVVARLEPRRCVIRDEQRADRQAVRKAFRERDRVGLHAELLPREEAAGAADARLHLVEDQQRAVLVRERARLCEELGRERMDAAFALHRLEQDRGRVRPDVLEPERAPGTSGSNAARFAGWPVTESAPNVRPWNEPSSATISVRPVALRAHLSAASTASAPELQKNALAPPKRSESFAASSCIGVVQ